MWIRSSDIDWLGGSVLAPYRVQSCSMWSSGCVNNLEWSVLCGAVCVDELCAAVCGNVVLVYLL